MDDSYYKSLSPFFGKWEIDEKLGEGGSGKVYLISTKSDNQVFCAAMKAISIPPNDTEDTSIRAEHHDEETITKYYRAMVDDVVNELQLLNQLRDSKYITSYEEHEIREHSEGIGWDVFIRQELLTPLIDLMATKTFEENDVIRIGIDICNALIDCEKHKIVHRDIKPENIFVTDNGTYKLGDFGIAKTLERTIVGFSKKGTYEYMAPEVYRKERGSAAVDIYSLGLVLYKLLNENRGPFLPAYPEPIMFADREKALTQRLKGATITPPKNGSRLLKSAVLSACAYNPTDRFKTASEFKDALVRAGNTSNDDEIASIKTKDKHRKRRHRSVIIAILVVFLAVACYWAMQVRDITGVDSSVEVYIGDSIAPQYRVKPSYLGDKDIDFVIDGDEAAVDKDGRITGLALGNATMTMTSGRYEEQIEIKVVPKVTDIICDDNYFIYVGEKEQIDLTIKPDKFSDEPIEFKSSDESVIMVNDKGEITAKGAGDARIEITSGGFNKEISVEVSRRPVTQTVKKNSTRQTGNQSKGNIGSFEDDEYF